MDLDEFKREFSNKDTLTEAIPYFWNKLDKDVYSIWQCEYNLDLSSKQSWQVANLVNGMYQRLEKLRKHAFASMIIFGGDKTGSISGLWFWRTKDLVFPLSGDWTIDYESYDWKKLDTDAPETKKLVQNYFLGDKGTFDKTVYEYNIFK